MTGKGYSFCAHSGQRIMFLSSMCTAALFFLLAIGQVDIGGMNIAVSRLLPANTSSSAGSKATFLQRGDSSVVVSQSKATSLQRGDSSVEVSQCNSSQLLSAIEQGGSWTMVRQPDKRELAELKAFMFWTNQRIKVPNNPQQRPDGRCGNIGMAPYIRGNCDPERSTPCCYNNQCVNRTVEQCRCPNCWDLRRDIYAEFATYQLKDPKCQISQFPSDPKAICPVIQGMTIKFIGDSLIRQTFTSFAAVMKNGDMNAVMFPKTSAVDRKNCNGQKILVNGCKHLVNDDIKACNNTAQVTELPYYRARYAKDILKTVRLLLGRPGSVIFLGIGLHDNLNTRLINEEVVHPLGRLLKNSVWPKVVWVTPNCPGQMKFYRGQHKANVIRYIREMKKSVARYNFPFLDLFKVTEGLYSYDGTHFGKGGNEGKVQLILNWIQKFRKEINF